MSSIHPTAIVSSKAELGKNVTVGPYAIIEDNVIKGGEVADTLIDIHNLLIVATDEEAIRRLEGRKQVYLIDMEDIKRENEIAIVNINKVARGLFEKASDESEKPHRFIL